MQWANVEGPAPPYPEATFVSVQLIRGRVP